MAVAGRVDTDTQVFYFNVFCRHDNIPQQSCQKEGLESGAIS
jgi:hypothetical protein